VDEGKNIRRSAILEIVGITIILFTLCLILIQYALPFSILLNKTSLDSYVDVNNYFYKPLNKTLTPLGNYNPLSKVNDKRADYSSYYSYVNYTQIESEAALIGAGNYINKGNASSIVVLNYHGTIANNDTDEYSISIEDFKAHMFNLKKEGYETVKIKDFYEFLKGERDIPDKSFLLTFDDGIRDTYYNSDPVLKALNYSAVMFVITSQSIEQDRRYYLNANELIEMQSSGRWEIESHSYEGHSRIKTNSEGKASPFFSNKMWLDEKQRLESDEEFDYRVRNDLAVSKYQLEKSLGKEITGFALPFGEFGQRETNYKGSESVILNATEDYYKMVFYQFKPAINKDFRANYADEPGNDFYLVMRISADYIRSADTLLQEMRAAQSLSLPYNEKFDNPKQWVSVWGRVNFTYIENSVDCVIPPQNSLDGKFCTKNDTINRIFRNSIIISNNPGGGGAMVYLDGSYLWKDYQANVVIDEHDVQKIILAARFHDSYNYIGCKYQSNSISIIKVNNQKKEEINETNIRHFPAVQNYLIGKPELGIRVVGNHVSCYINNNLTVQAYLNDIPKNGGIGVRLENLDSGEQSIKFHSIKTEIIEKDLLY